MKRKFLALTLSMLLVCSLVACGEKEEDSETGSFEPTMAVMLVMNEKGPGDHAYNDKCWSGCEKAKEELFVDVDYVVAADADSYKAAIDEAVNSEVDLVICADSAMAASLKEATEEYPMQAFAIVDASDIGTNVVGMTFNAEEGSFLAGIVAGMMNESGIVSYIGGVPSEAQYKYQYGFQAGVATASSDTQMATGWVESYSDTDTAKKIAVAHGTLGSDIVYQSAGNAGEGIVEAGDERGFYVIGTGHDQSYLAEDAVLCSVEKCADVAVYDVINSYITGEFYERGDVTYSLANGGVAISDPAGHIPEEVSKVVEEYKEKIASGSLEVPYNWSTWNTYTKSLENDGSSSNEADVSGSADKNAAGSDSGAGSADNSEESAK